MYIVSFIYSYNFRILLDRLIKYNNCNYNTLVIAFRFTFRVQLVSGDTQVNKHLNDFEFMCVGVVNTVKQRRPANGHMGEIWKCFGFAAAMELSEAANWEVS